MKQTTVKSVFARQETVLLIILLAYATFVSIVNPAFLHLDNIFDVAKSSAGTMVLAMGTLVVLISGGIDVSFAAIAIVSGYVSIRLFITLGISNIYLSFLVSGLIGAGLGAINGFLIQRFGLQALIVTLATQNIYIGLLSVTLGTKFIPVGQMPEAILGFGSRALVSVPEGDMTANLTLFIIPVVLVVFITWAILNRTMLGRSIYALGGNSTSAIRSGVSVWKTRMFVYVYAGALAGVMGVIYAAEVRSLNPISLVGNELTIIAAVVLGGARLTGGYGTILGTVLGVLIISILNTTLILIGLSASWNSFFVGIIIIASVTASAIRVKRENRRRLIFS